MEFEPVIGLEVHAQLKTETKIFCGCSTRFGSPPNDNTCPVCLALPGALPVLNQKVVELALRASLALDCTVPADSIFARKNYFYPDLPKGYQISQFDQPIAVGGRLNIQKGDSSHEIRIRRIHMEEDAGKLFHDQDSDSSTIDLNRAGVPLIEIVTEPDLRSSEESYLYLKGLKSILQFCDISDANMEEGNLRCDANISIRPVHSNKLGTRVEIKNLNSFKNVMKALDYEFERQSAIVKSGGEIVQETRLYDADSNKTESMRSKEEAQDYRYFPDPDLLPLKIDSVLLERVRKSLPELPETKKERFQQQYQLSKMEADILTESTSLAEFYEKTVSISGEPKLSANWILQNVLEQIKDGKQSIDGLTLTPGHLAALIQLVVAKKISNTQAREVFHEMWVSGSMPDQVVAEKGMTQVSDADVVNRYIDKVFADHRELADRYRGGEVKLQGVLVGLVMKESSGKANPGLVSQLIQNKLKVKS